MADEQLQGFRRMYGGFQASRVILTANNLRLFDATQRGPVAASELAGAMGTDLRATTILLNALSGLGLLRKLDGAYSNTPMASRFMVSGAPEYQGDIIRHADNMWRGWSRLDDVLRSGRPAEREGFDHEAFIMGMHNLSALKAGEVLGAIGLKGVGRALDIGGGPGTYCLEMARRGIAPTLLDTPETIIIARRVARAAGVKGISFKSGDFMSMKSLGRGFDLAFISQILHAYGEADCRGLLKKARKALNPGGRVAIQEFPVSEDHTQPPHGALFAVNMLVATDEGRTYSVAEMSAWLRAEGFRKPRVRETPDYVLLIAGG